MLLATQRTSLYVWSKILRAVWAVRWRPLKNCRCINELLQENKKLAVFSDDQHGFGPPPMCFLPWSPKSPIHSMCCIFNAWKAMVFFLFIKGENPTQTRYGGNALWPCGCTKMSSHSRKNELNSVVMCFIQSYSTYSIYYYPSSRKTFVKGLV